MRNILVGALYDLGADYPVYKELTEISLKRIAAFNPEIDEFVVLVNNSGVRSTTEMFREWFHKVHSLWQSGDVNILMIETDVLCHGSVMPLYNGDKFMMYSSGSAADPEEFNSGIVYFPASMDPSLWEPMLESTKAGNWNTKWAFNQQVMDKVFKSQFGSYDACIEEIKKYGPVGKYNWFEGLFKSDLKSQDAILTHHFTSRGPHRLLELYKKHDLASPVPIYRTL